MKQSQTDIVDSSHVATQKDKNEEGGWGDKNQSDKSRFFLEKNKTFFFLDHTRKETKAFSFWRGDENRL